MSEASPVSLTVSSEKTACVDTHRGISSVAPPRKGRKRPQSRVRPTGRITSLGPALTAHEVPPVRRVLPPLTWRALVSPHGKLLAVLHDRSTAGARAARRFAHLL